MPAAKKETKVEEPLFVDEEGSYVHESEQAKYKGGIRRYAQAAGSDNVSATTTTAATAATAAAAVSANGGRSASSMAQSSKAGASPPSTAVGGSAAAAAAAASAASGNNASLGSPGDAATVVRHGHGTYTCPSFTYVGDWVEDEMEGHGQLRFAQSGNVYDGAFSRGCFSGQGTYTWANGAVYSGQWRANRMHGEGVYTDVEGHSWRGRYYNGTGPGLIRLYPTLERMESATLPEATPANAASA